MKFEYTWRWYGPNDPVTLSDIKQTGATGIVHALHHKPVGDTWETKEILERKELIESYGLSWSVVESVPVHEDIKKRSGDFEKYLENYATTLKNLGEAGIYTVCYNFMPILDWTRTDLDYPVGNGAFALRYDQTAFAAFELFILKREGAEAEYSTADINRAHKYFVDLSDEERLQLKNNIIAGLPGGNDSYSLEAFQQMLDSYQHISPDALKENLKLFLEAVVPAAETAKVNLCIHPDDPPFPILGLPRVVSTETDIERILTEVDSPNNGVTFCTGSFGARKDNDLVRMAKRFADRVHFLHFRSVQLEENGSFFEADHLQGNGNLVAVMNAFISSDKLPDSLVLPIRPDHGHKMLDDINKKTNPGYSCIGRMKGLSELQGIEQGLRFISSSQ